MKTGLEHWTSELKIRVINLFKDWPPGYEVIEAAGMLHAFEALTIGDDQFSGLEVVNETARRKQGMSRYEAVLTPTRLSLARGVIRRSKLEAHAVLIEHAVAVGRFFVHQLSEKVDRIAVTDRRTCWIAVQLDAEKGTTLVQGIRHVGKGQPFDWRDHADGYR